MIGRGHADWEGARRKKRKKRITLQVPTKTPAKGGGLWVGETCKRGFAASDTTDGNVNTIANSIRCKVEYD